MDPNSTNNSNSQNRPQGSGTDDLFAPRYATPNQPQPHGFSWQQNETQQIPQSPPVPEVPQAPQATPAMPTPMNQLPPMPGQATSWQPRPLSQAGPAPNATVVTPGMPPQYGEPMAELPPLNGGSVPKPPHSKSRQKHKMILIGLAAVVGLALLTVVTLLIVSILNTDKNKAPSVPAVSYISDKIDELAKNKQVDVEHVQQLDKTAAFYTVFKKAAQQPAVHTRWSVYYSTTEQEKRGDQFTMYDVAVDYRSKAYAYAEDSNSVIGAIQSRCIEGQQFTFNGSKLSGGSGWQPASDSSTCKFGVVATRMNDGVNAGGLTDGQANTFVQKLNASQVVHVNGVTVETVKDVPYMKFDVSVTPRQAAQGIYWGMQNFMTAFQSTGLNPQTHPYTYFGTGNEGLHLIYYVDPATQLPVYSQMTSTPAYSQMGKPVTPDSWSHRFVEYEFPAQITQPTLDDSTPIGFKAWSDR